MLASNGQKNNEWVKIVSLGEGNVDEDAYYDGGNEGHEIDGEAGGAREGSRECGPGEE